MNNETIEIKKKEVIALYRSVDKNGKYLLEVLFGKEMLKPKDVTERIKTFHDAYCELGNDHPFVKSYEKYVNTASGEEPDVIAYFKLRIICAALNEGWEPKFTEDEWRYYPWFRLYTQDKINNMNGQYKQDQHLIYTGDYETEYAGFASAYSADVPSSALPNIGSRLCLKNEVLAIYCGKQFVDIWADYLLIRK